MRDSTAESGSAATITGDASTSYQVNTASLSGSVTGAGFDGFDGVPLSWAGDNNVTESFNGAAGITQNAQNLGASSLIQQGVAISGTVNVNQ